MLLKPIDVPTPSLTDLLKDEYDALCRFVDFSESEQNALIASDADNIERLAMHKQALLTRIASCRDATKRALGEPLTSDQLRDRLFHAGHGAQTAFEMVIAKAREASDLTQLSTRLVTHQMRRLNGLANALANTSVQANGYDDTGFTRMSGIASSYGRA
jgi:flagellar biosynthesis/type III secretory pathway chaperone